MSWSAAGVCVMPGHNIAALSAALTCTCLPVYRGPMQVGKMRAWNQEVRQQGIAGVMGRAEEGSYEQRKEDAYLL